ncbi:MAG: hypothetical protein FWG14_10985 [Peptococcaceae bacterium]|nr:hypothetical protein [Peptococcaceae bacterium]
MTKEEMQELKVVLVDVVETRLARTEETFDSTLTAMEEAMDSKLTAMEEAMDSKLTVMEEAMDSKLTAMEEAMDSKLTALEKSLRKDMATKADLEQMATKADLEEVSKRLRKLEFKVEHDIDKAIKVTMDGHAILNRKLDLAIGLESRVETLEHKMSAVEYTIREQRTTQ